MFQKVAILLALWVLICAPSLSYSAQISLDDALRATYTACYGIDEELKPLKVKAGINTAVTAVGTVAGAGALATGLVKKKTDKEIEELEKKLQELRIYQAQNGIKYNTPEESRAFRAAALSGGNADAQSTDSASSTASASNSLSASDNAPSEADKIQAEIDEKTKKSVKLGNWRTGLLAGNTATNIAGAAIAGTNKVKGELDEQITDCIAAVQQLRRSIEIAKIEGADISEANGILNACGKYETVDTSKINKRATGAMVASTVGAATGAVGTVASIFANTKKTRDDNSDAGKKKEKNLNTTANVMSGLATAASGTATVFNATQIKAIKDVSEVATECTGALQ